jgi:Na+-driven multidrug efflux pump
LPGEAIAIGTVVSLIGGVLLAWPLQVIAGWFNGGINEAIVDWVSVLSMITSVAIVFGFFLRGKVRESGHRVSPSGETDKPMGQ